jgi:hypothetical protein
MTPGEEIDLWFAEQIAIHGEPATEDDLGRNFILPGTHGSAKTGKIVNRAN